MRSNMARWETLESNFQKWQSDPMANLDDVLIFVKVAQFESISRAARSLGMPISTVTQHSRAVHSYGCYRSGLPGKFLFSPSTRIGNSWL